ncbi:MAG: NADH-quinone oxidoreductase subunit NuoH [Armatimonadota bacterium]|nr:NADH-quinone oxidoreductase subunit NuoH [Armatimonadota bacterium]
MPYFVRHPIDALLGAMNLHSQVSEGLYEVVRCIIVALLIFGFVMTSVLFLILGLRKYLGFLQSRLGPNRIGGPWGLAQTMMDAMKLLTKEDIVPTLADRFVFDLAPILVFVPAFMVYVVIPWSPTGIPKDLDIGVIYIAAVTSIGVIGIVMAGWASNNKYSQLAAFRSAGQMISYEVPMVLALVGPVILSHTFSLQGIVRAQSHQGWFIFLLPIGFIVYMISGLAETNLTPFDLVEAESELIAGFTTEYSGMKFALFFLAEFASNFTVAAIGTTLFLGGWSRWPLMFLPSGFDGWPWFFMKCIVIVILLFHIRGTLPRVRVDQLMDLGWKFLIPAALVQLVIAAAYVALGIPAIGIVIINVILVVIILGLAGRSGVLKSGGGQNVTEHIQEIRDKQRRRALI